MIAQSDSTIRTKETRNKPPVAHQALSNCPTLNNHSRASTIEADFGPVRHPLELGLFSVYVMAPVKISGTNI